MNCTSHPDRLATFRCETCEDLLCSDCAAPVELRDDPRARSTVFTCLHCRGYAAPVKVRRSVATPFSTLAWGAGPWAVQRTALLTALACTAVITVASALGAGGIVRALVLGYLFEIVRATAAGHDEVPLPTDSGDFLADVLGPALRLLVSMIWVLGLFALPFYVPALDGWGYALFAWTAAALYVPSALLVAAAGARILEVANPLVILGCGLRLGADWLRLAAFGALAFAARALVGQIETRFGGQAVFGVIGANLFVTVPCTFALCVLAMAGFRAAGLLLRVRGDDLGYGRAEDYLDPLAASKGDR